MTARGVLFHARNRRGLGHLVRASNLATALTHHAPELDVRVHATRRPADGLWCPSITLTSDDDQSWATTVTRFAPRVIVHDTTIERLDQPCGSRRHVLVLRRRTHAQHDALMADPALVAVDRFIVPHDAEEFGHDLPAAVAARTTFVGPITRAARTSRAATRSRHGIAPDAFLLTVTVGGGGFTERADRFFELAASVVPAVRAARRDAVAVVVLGPNYDSTSVAERLAGVPGTTVMPFLPDLVDLVTASDLVVAEGGYNTVNEIRVAGVPAVFVPSARTLDDQFERVTQVARTGAAIVIDPARDLADTAAQVARLASSSGRLDALRDAARRHQRPTGNAHAAAAIAEEVR